MIRKELQRTSILLVFALGFIELLLAQPVKINSMLDTSQMLIGDQIQMDVTVQYADSLDLQFPFYEDTIINGIEVISSEPLDTLVNSQGLLSIRQRMLISSFDTGAYMIPAGPFVTKNGDTAWGQKLFLSVNTMEIDTTKGPADIKLPYTAPVTFEEVLPYLWIGLVALILIGIAVYIYLVVKKKRDEQKPKIVIPSDPPHIIAYRELDRLKEQKLWQQEKYKLYYSRLSEIARAYIEHKFEVPALEQTSDEILTVFNAKQLIKSDSYLLLQQVLQTADLAKFAKAEPLPEENERNFNNVFDFVSQTKLINMFGTTASAEKETGAGADSAAPSAGSTQIGNDEAGENKA